MSDSEVQLLVSAIGHLGDAVNRLRYFVADSWPKAAKQTVADVDRDLDLLGRTIAQLNEIRYENPSPAGKDA